MDAGHYEEAEAVYRADLGLDSDLPRPMQHPRNVWSLHGLHECLVRREETVELPHVKLLLDQAVARAYVPIRASCLCRSLAGYFSSTIANLILRARGVSPHLH